MRLVVTGTNGQVARALRETPAPGFEVIAIGRPDFDLGKPAQIEAALRAAAPDVIVNAAAFTAVDKAEEDQAGAFALNEAGARAAAQAAAALGAALIHFSTDYVFDGAKDAPYAETDATAPLNIYGASKLAGERAVAEAAPNHAIVRLSWVYGPHGSNFVRTMLRLAETRDEIAVVSDQRGAPTYAPDIAAATVRIAANLAARPEDARLRGLFHLAPQGDTNWAAFAEAIFAASRARGGAHARVRPIPTSDYPTPAARPANSRLDASKLAAAHGVRLPPWRTSLAACMDRLIGPEIAQ